MQTSLLTSPSNYSNFNFTACVLIDLYQNVSTVGQYTRCFVAVTLKSCDQYVVCLQPNIIDFIQASQIIKVVFKLSCCELNVRYHKLRFVTELVFCIISLQDNKATSFPVDPMGHYFRKTLHVNELKNKVFFFYPT